MAGGLVNENGLISFDGVYNSQNRMGFQGLLLCTVDKQVCWLAETERSEMGFLFWEP